MTLLVPFDGSQLAKAALLRAAQFDRILEEGVVAVAVIPWGNAEYARDLGWIEAGEPFDGEKITEKLSTTVSEITPDATFEYLQVDRWAPSGTISNKLRRFAREQNTTIVFIGSENAGKLTRSFSVGSSVGADTAYDTMIITNSVLPEVEKLEEQIPSDIIEG